MLVFLSWDGDHLGRLVGQARLNDDVAQVRQVDHLINAGNEIWKSFALRVGGSVIEIGGDEGAIELPAGSLSEATDIARQYGETVGATVSVGVGLRLSESMKALIVAKFRGGNQVVIWDQSMQDEVDAASKPQTEEEKIGSAYLRKWEEDKSKAGAPIPKDGHPAKYSGDNAGFSVKSKPNHKVKPYAHQSAPHEKSNPSSASAPKEDSHSSSSSSSSSPEVELHGLAQDQGSQDQADQQQKGDEADSAKQGVAKTLLAIREQMPQIQQLQQQAPDIYQSIMGLVQGVIALGRAISSDEQQLGKSELAKSVAGVRGVPTGAGGHDYSHLLPEHAKAAWPNLKLHVTQHAPDEMSTTLHNGRELVGTVSASIDNGGITPHSTLANEYHSKGLGQSMYEALYSHAKNHLGINRVDGGLHSGGASRVHQALAAKHGFDYVPKKLSTSTYAPYSYTIKDEMNSSISDDDLIGAGKGVAFSRTDKAEPLEKAMKGRLVVRGDRPDPHVNFRTPNDLSTPDPRDFANRPGHVYRGIGQAEHDYIVKNGHIMTNASRNIDQHEGTCFSNDFGTAESYTNNGSTNPARTGAPTYVLEVKHHPSILHDRRDDYMKSQTPVPADHITRAWKYTSRQSPEEGTWGQTGFQSTAKPDGVAKAELEKGGGSEAGRVHENLPVGTLKDAKLKVRHEDGSVGWENVKSGLVQGTKDRSPWGGPNSHPVPSRQPNGK